jgi:hypothetical protein
MLQFMVAPEWDVVSGVGMDVPGLEEGEYWVDRVSDDGRRSCGVVLDDDNAQEA